MKNLSSRSHRILCALTSRHSAGAWGRPSVRAALTLAATALLLAACGDLDEIVGEPEALEEMPVFTRSVLEGFDAEIAAALERYRVPGAVVVAVFRDHAVFTGAYGLRHVERRLPMTEGSLFRIGGATALLSSTMLATLVDEQRLDWRLSLPSGLSPALLDSLAPADAARWSAAEPLDGGSVDSAPEPVAAGASSSFAADSLAGLLGRATLAADPFGGASSSSVVGRELDAYAALVERALEAAGEPQPKTAFRRIMHERLFGPAGMVRTAVADRLPALAEEFATPYVRTFGGELSPIDYAPPAAGTASAGVVSTAGDLGLFLIVHLQDGIARSGKRVASGTNLEAARRGVFYAEPEAAGKAWPLAERCCGAGAGWWTARLGGGDTWNGGEGGIDGYVAELGLLPERQLGLVVLANLDGRLGGRHFAREVRDAFLARVLGRSGTVSHRLDHERSVAGLERLGETARPVSAAAVRPFLGAYDGGWTLGLEAGRLQLSKDLQTFTLAALEENYVIASGPRLGTKVRFERTGDGTSMVLAPRGSGEQSIAKRR